MDILPGNCKFDFGYKDVAKSRLLGEISITSNMQMTPTLTAESEEELKSLLMKVKEESEKVKVKSLSRVRLFATPWTAAHQAFLFFTISQSLLKLKPISHN